MRRMTTVAYLCLLLLPAVTACDDSPFIEGAIHVGVVVTDLDAPIDVLLEANINGAIAVIHARGDNIEAVRNFVPRFSGRIIGTAQCSPPPGLHNFGGFTDGDRAVLMAHHFGAGEIELLGFDFATPGPKPGSSAEVKAKKLAWAKRLIALAGPAFGPGHP